MKSLVSNHIKKPRVIASILKENNLGNYTVNQAANMKRAISKENEVLNYGDMFRLLHQHTNISNDPNQMFVAGYQVDHETEDVKFVVTSKTLLKNIKKFRFIQTDGTFKVTYFNTPFLALGKLNYQS